MNDENNVKPEKTGGPGTLSLIKAIAFVSAIVAVECVAASMFLPSATETEAAARRIAAASTDQVDTAEPDAVDDLEVAREEVREVSLGKYYVTSYQPESNTTLRIDFDLFATVLATEEEEFQTLFGQNQHRLSEQVHVTLRGAELTDLTDAGLGLIKRRILEKSNRTLGKPLLHEVIFSQFSFIEQ